MSSVKEATLVGTVLDAYVGAVQSNAELIHFILYLQPPSVRSKDRGSSKCFFLIFPYISCISVCDKIEQVINYNCSCPDSARHRILWIWHRAML